VADVKCGLHKINDKFNRTNATCGPSPVRKHILRPNRLTEAMLNQTGPGLALTLDNMAITV